MSVSVASSITNSSHPYVPPSEMLSSYHGEDSIRPPSSKRRRSNGIEPPGKDNPEDNHTVVNCEINEPVKLDIGEEILKQCELDSGFHEDYNPNINEDLAKRVIKYFEKGAEHAEPRKVLFKKYKPPANLEKLDAPRMNPGVLNLECPRIHET